MADVPVIPRLDRGRAAVAGMRHALPGRHVPRVHLADPAAAEHSETDHPSILPRRVAPGRSRAPPATMTTPPIRSPPPEAGGDRRHGFPRRSGGLALERRGHGVPGGGTRLEARVAAAGPGGVG